MTRRAAALERDAVTTAGYVTLVTFAWFIYTLGPTVPLLRAEQETSRTLASMHNVAFAVGVVVTGLVGVRILRRTQRDGGIRLGVLLLAVGSGTLVLGSLPDGGAIPATLGAAFIAGVGGALAVNAATAMLSDRHGAAGATAVAEGNAVASTVGLLAPLAVGAATAIALTWRAAALVLIPLAAAAWVATGRAGDADAFAPAAARTGETRALPAAYWLLWVALIACMMVETGFVTWTPDLLRDRVGLGAGAAAATTSAFLTGMAVGRVTVARFSVRFATMPLFAGCVVLSAAGWALMWTAHNPALALTGLVLAGLGVAGHFPLASVLLIDASDGEPDRALALMSIGLGTATGAGPFAVGSLADVAGIFLAFAVIPVCLLIALLAAGLAARRGTLARRASVRL